MRILLLILACLLTSASYAVFSLGGFADSMSEPVQVISNFVNVGCIIIGVACLFAAIVKYFEHRRSPLHVPLGTVIWLVIIAVALLALPFTYLLTGYGVPFTLTWGGST
jgi:hypothetical protein